MGDLSFIINSNNLHRLCFITNIYCLGYEQIMKKIISVVGLMKCLYVYLGIYKRYQQLYGGLKMLYKQYQ